MLAADPGQDGGRRRGTRAAAPPATVANSTDVVPGPPVSDLALALLVEHGAGLVIEVGDLVGALRAGVLPTGRVVDPGV